MAFTDYGNYDALGLAELVRRRQVTPAELVEAAITRAERVNPRLGAIVIPLYDDARRAAAAEDRVGPLAGVPFLVKDLTPTSQGRRPWRAAAFWPGTRPLTMRQS